MSRAVVRGSVASRPLLLLQTPQTSAKTRTAMSLTKANMNQNIVRLQYAVRGPLVIRAGEIEKELAAGKQKPFKRTIRANIGDAHAMGQVPITFIRQVLACCAYPELLEQCDFADDVKSKTRAILAGCGGKSMGSYTGSYGIDVIRQNVADYIKRRDGHPAKMDDICLSAGASPAIKNVMQLFDPKTDGKPTALMIPIPQYPLYTATLAEFGLSYVTYYLNEEKNWSLELPELQRAYDEGKCKFAIKAIVCINPGNPTGQVLSKKNIEDIIKFAHKNKLFLLADEVYQDNIYAEGCEFFSFKKILRDLGDPYSSELELASFMSVSKGYAGECGLRGGWMELVNMDPAVQTELYKAISAMLCPSSLGQAGVDCIARPPQQGEPSHEVFQAEKKAVLDALALRAQMIAEAFNDMPGFSCQTVQGAMYAFPNIKLPPKAIEAAKAAKQPPDVFYAFRLLEETGICIVPGSGFGQKPGTYHFRTTILPQTDLLKEMLDIFKTFQSKFTKDYS